MTQIKISLGGSDLYDCALDAARGDHLEMDEEETTSVLIALCTELRATAAQAPDPSDLGGSWHESYYDDAPVGCLTWTLLGRGMTSEVIGLAEQYQRAALKRWTDAGYVLTWSAVQAPPNELRCTLTLEKTDKRISVAVPVLV